jgi:two-component system chemotaxis response regulator CheB
MVTDDSAVIRGLITRALESDPEIVVVTTVSNGEMALTALGRYDIEVVILDIEMPVMDGLTALPKLIAAQPGLQVVMASTLTRRNADISLKALAAGAADYVAKPTSTAQIGGANEFRTELIAKIKALAGARRRARGVPPPSARSSGDAPKGTILPLRPSAPAGVVARGALALRSAMVETPEIIAIGSSTGGPQALFEVMGALRGGLPQPIVITQHMPATFTTILAEHITRQSGLPTVEGADGMPLERGRVYVAPGDFHMTIDTVGTGRVLRLSKAPPENYCRPSVDPMLRSVVKAYGRRVLTVILTGMGHDGLHGGEAVVAAGGCVIAQDEATSVVWGMPGAVAQAGLCSAVLPLKEIAPYVRRVATRSGS